MDDIATRVEQLRCERGWSKVTLAQRASLHPQHIYKILSGERNRIEADTLRAFARAFAVSADYLLGLTDDPTPAATKRRRPRPAPVVPEVRRAITAEVDPRTGLRPGQASARYPRRLGGWEGRLWVSEDFDETDEETIRAFEDGESEDSA